MEIIWKMLWKPEEYGAQHSLISSLITTYVKLRQVCKAYERIAVNVVFMTKVSYLILHQLFRQVVFPDKNVFCLWVLFL